MNDTALPRYRFLSGFDFCVVDYELYCYPWLPCSKKRVRAVLRQFRNKKAAITGGGYPRYNHRRPNSVHSYCDTFSTV